MNWVFFYMNEDDKVMNLTANGPLVFTGCRRNVGFPAVGDGDWILNSGQ